MKTIRTKQAKGHFAGSSVYKEPVTKGDVKKRRQKSQGTIKLVESLSKQATLLSPLRKPEVIISQARTVVSPRFAN